MEPIREGEAALITKAQITFQTSVKLRKGRDTFKGCREKCAQDGFTRDGLGPLGRQTSQLRGIRTQIEGGEKTLTPLRRVNFHPFVKGKEPCSSNVHVGLRPRRNGLVDTIFFLSSWDEVLLCARKTLAAQGLVILQRAHLKSIQVIRDNRDEHNIRIADTTFHLPSTVSPLFPVLICFR